MHMSLNYVKLVYPPISNQVAEWLSSDPEVRKFVERSKIYMLGQRKQIMLENYVDNKDDATLSFDLVCGSISARNLKVCTYDLVRPFSGDVVIDIGPEIIKIWGPEGEDDILHYWATTDKLLYDFWRGRIDIQGLDSVIPFTKFDLYYVGISKKNDSFSRLFDNGHKNRTSILTNETQYSERARLSDEISIFLFDIESVGLKVLDPDDEDFEFPFEIDKEILIADAEKAFISVLESKYNRMQYKNYPAGADGLSEQGLTSYGYFIHEDLTFVTPKGKIRGRHASFDGDGGHADVILIEGDTVRVLTPEDDASDAA